MKKLVYGSNQWQINEEGNIKLQPTPTRHDFGKRQ